MSSKRLSEIIFFKKFSKIRNLIKYRPSYKHYNENNLTFHIHDFMNKGKIYKGDENYLGFPDID